MDFLPTITCDGDQELFRQFNQEIERKLPGTTIEWKRSHGRPSKLVVVKAQIARLAQKHLEYTIDTTPSLQCFPFFHMFWTDCQDFEEYRSDLKEKIAKWVKRIKANSGIDWLIIQVNSPGSLKGNKPKLQLPRSSLFDRIKSDFGGGKANDRCIQLWEPSKHELTGNPRSVESWSAFMNKLRQSVLTAIDRNLRKFEEKVRSIRDKRTERSWDFTDYFLCHEQVAMVYEIMGLNEEALIHYDEVDALMNQLMIKIKFSEQPGCLAPFAGECWCWDGASISQDSEKKLRASIKKKEATLLDLRNYLFIRQCALLFQLDRVQDVLQRMLEFMHNVVHELEILKVSVPPGAAACWVTLTSLQLIRATIQKNAEFATYSLHTAHIYQYARQKLFQVGALCGLMPDATSTDQQLHIACELTAGVGKNDEVKYSEGNPSNKLKTALSSKDGFKALYLELLQMAIKTYENIKRTRSAKILGIDLGKFYMSGGSYGDAEELLTEGYKMFAGEGWGLLAANTLICVAKCQYQLRNWEKYAQSCAVLACQAHLSEEERSFYTQELLTLKDDKQNPEHPLTLRGDPLFQPEQVKLHLTKSIATVGENVHAEVTLNSGLERLVDDCALSIVMRRTVSPQDSEPITLTNADDSSDTTDSLSDADSNKSRRDTSSSNDSVDPSGERKVKEKFSLDSGKVQLMSGAHTYHLHGKINKSGNFLLQQIVVKMGSLQLLASLQRLPKQTRKFQVVAESPKISWAQQDHDIPPVAGLIQLVSLTISTGPGATLDQSVMKIESASGLLFLPMECGQGIITPENENESQVTEAEYRIEISNAEDEDVQMCPSCSLILPGIPSYHKIQVNLVVFSKFENTDEKQLTVEHDVLCSATWLSSNNLSSLFLTCYKPFVLEHILHATKYGDLLQIILTGTTPADLVVSDVNLRVTNEVDPKKLIPLHTAVPQAVFYHSEVSFVWRLPKEFSKASEFELDLVYCSKMSTGETGKKRQFQHCFNIDSAKKNNVNVDSTEVTKEEAMDSIGLV